MYTKTNVCHSQEYVEIPAMKVSDCYKCPYNKYERDMGAGWYECAKLPGYSCTPGLGIRADCPFKIKI